VHDHGDVAALIERLVAQARIPGRARRDDLRRELWTHFEEAGTSPEAVRQFGEEASIAGSLRQVYRWDYACWYLAKIAASIVASIGAALLIEVLVHLRVELQAEILRLAPGFSRAAGMSVAVVLGVISVWEAARRPVNRSRAVAAIGAYAVVCVVVRVLFLTGFGALITATTLVGIGYLCSRLERWGARFVALVGAFAAALYLNHLLLSVTFGASRALMAGAVLGAVWSSTVAILNRIDRTFGRIVEPAPREAA